MSDDAEPITIGPAAPNDHRRIADLFFADMVDLGLEPSQGRLEEVARDALELDGDRCHLRVARNSDGLIIGVVLLNELLSIKFPGQALWIEELYVAPGYRQQGIGRRMIEHVLEWANSEGYRGIELEAYRMNTAASILYRSLGFRRLARERYSFDLSELEYEDA